MKAIEQTKMCIRDSYYVRAGYGMFHTPKWGLSVNNKLGWVLM